MKKEERTEPRQQQRHLNLVDVWNSCKNLQSKLPRYKDWYAKMYRYKSYYNDHSNKNELLKNRKQFIIWSWMKFLLPLAANEDTTNVTMFLNNIWNFIDRYSLVKCSLKMILEGYVTHIMQLVGVTNLVAFNHPLNGDEVPLRNFLYFLNGSMLQWLHANIQPNHGAIIAKLLYEAWEWENDWIVNDLQRYVLRTFMYSPMEDLDLSGFPKNMCLTFTKNKKNVVLRRLQYDRGKLAVILDLRTILVQLR